MSAPFVHRLEVRFRDCDPMGHANNAVYLTYLEQTRFAHWRTLRVFGERAGRSGGAATGTVEGDRPTSAPGVILARVECDYRRPVRAGDLLEVRLVVADIGRSSFRYEYEIVDDQGRTVLTAKTVQVMYDYATEKPVPIPDSIRTLLATHSIGPR